MQEAIVEYERAAGENGFVPKCLAQGCQESHRLSSARPEISRRRFDDQTDFDETIKQLTALEKNLAKIAADPNADTVGSEQLAAVRRLLADTSVPLDFDVLSVDVDGVDFHLWQAVREYRPKVVCIEYNRTIPNEVEFTTSAESSAAARSAGMGGITPRLPAIAA